MSHGITDRVRPEQCGRRRPVVHLFEAEELFGARSYWRASYPAVCGEEIPVPAPGTAADADEEGECPGCRDCLRYCSACVAEAARFAERAAGERSPV